MKFRYFLVLFTYSLAFLVSFLAYPISYFFRDYIRDHRANPICWFFWLFLNDTEKLNDRDIDYGDYGRFSHDFCGAIKQSVLRNNAWNMRITYFRVRKGKKINKSGFGSRLYNNNYPILEGETDTTYQIEGGDEWYFRKSATKKLPFKIPFVTVKDFALKSVNFTHYTYQFGATDSRYVCKFNLIKDVC